LPARRTKTQEGTKAPHLTRAALGLAALVATVVLAFAARATLRTGELLRDFGLSGPRR
jgi:hypothetical protein